jgi:phospholipid/cholesterol/gamma-HCH transport system permease protein
MIGERVAPEPPAARASVERALGSSTQVLAEVGDVVILGAKTVVSALRAPRPYGAEFVNQFLFALRVCWLPLLVSTFCFSYASLGVLGGNLGTLLGSPERIGGFFGLFSTREIAPMLSAVVVAGAAGTAMCGDLGARKIREELDALQVIGVEPIKHLVVPRFLALMLITPLLTAYGIFFGMFAGAAASLVIGVPLHQFLYTLANSAPGYSDLWASVLKTACFGAIIAVVCCYKGMTASAGPEGVGRAVNQAVVIALLAVFAFNYVFTQVFLATHPEVSVTKVS